MTPVALALAKSLLIPAARREVFDQHRRLSLMPQACCFELTAVREVADDLEAAIYKRDLIPQTRLAFLPAPVTVIEYFKPFKYGRPDPMTGKYEKDCGGRVADLLIESDDKSYAEVYGLEEDAIIPIGRLLLKDDAELSGALKGERAARSVDGTLAMKSRKAGLYARLALINTPRIIGRKQHMPHAGFQKRLAASRGMVGKFPLLAWTEIILEITPPRVDTDEHEAHLTGRKALHFCRSHLRIQNGRLVLVTAHWRGDPALGIKRSRYVVRAPRK